MKSLAGNDSQSSLLFLDTGKVFSGAEFSLLQLCQALDKEKFSASICFDYPQDHQKAYAPLGLPTYYRAQRCTWWMGSDRWRRPLRGSDFAKRHILGYRLYKLIKASKAQIFHLNLTWPRSFWDLWYPRTTGVVVVAHVRSLLPDFRLKSSLLHQADKVVCVSDAVKERVLSWCDHPNVIRVYDPIDCGRYVCGLTKEGARRVLGLPIGGAIAASIALLSPHKGHDTAIKAFAILAKSFSNLSLYIAGGNPDHSRDHSELQRLKAVASDLGVRDRVFFSESQVKNVEVVYRASDVIYALTNCGEAFGRVALESGAAMRPVIATSLGATPELVLHGQTGFLVPGESPEAVAAHSKHLLSHQDLSESMASAALRHVQKHFSPESHALAMTQIYQEPVRSGRLCEHVKRGVS